MPARKLIFWMVVLGGDIAAASGYMLLFPFYQQRLPSMQLAQIIGVLDIASMLVDTYMGTIEGPFEGMAKGEVDVN
jgi:formate dehydrogenase subunit gamma